MANHVQRHERPSAPRPGTLPGSHGQVRLPSYYAAAVQRPVGYAGSRGSQAHTALNKSRRLYVGNIPYHVGISEQGMVQLFSAIYVSAFRALEPGDPLPVSSFWLHADGKFGFMELRGDAEAVDIMQLNGVVLHGRALRVNRPSDYRPEVHGPAYIAPSKINVGTFLDLCTKLDGILAPPAHLVASILASDNPLPLPTPMQAVNNEPSRIPQNVHLPGNSVDQVHVQSSDALLNSLENKGASAPANESASLNGSTPQLVAELLSQDTHSLPTSGALPVACSKQLSVEAATTESPPLLQSPSTAQPALSAQAASPTHERSVGDEPSPAHKANSSMPHGATVASSPPSHVEGPQSKSTSLVSAFRSQPEKLHENPTISKVEPSPSTSPLVIVCLRNLVTDDDLDGSQDDYEDLVADVREECSNYGKVADILVPQKGLGRGAAFIAYHSKDEAELAVEGIRKLVFNGRAIEAMTIPEASSVEQAAALSSL